MKVAFITKAFGSLGGSNTNVTTHYHAVIHNVGINNVYTVDLTDNGNHVLTEKFLAYGGPPVSKLERLRRWLQFNDMCISSKIIGEICKMITDENIDIAFVDESLLGKLVQSIKKNCNGVIVISFYHDVKRNLMKEWVRENGLRYVPRFLISCYNEMLTARLSDINIVLNHRERDFLFKYYGNIPFAELPVGISGKHDIDKSSSRKGKIQLLFVCGYYYPNIHGIQWFCREVLPNIEDFCDLIIVGRDTERLKNSLESDSVHVIGTVATLEPYYNSADIAIAPVFEGAGMKVKTAQAFSYGKRFFGTSESLTGYQELIPDSCKDLIVECNTADEYMKEIMKLKDLQFKKCSPEILDFYESEFSEDAITKKMLRILKDAEEIGYGHH